MAAAEVTGRDCAMEQATMADMALTLRADTPIRATTVPASLGFIRDLAGGAPVTTAAASMDGAVIGGSNSSR